jgi:exopolysaccharide biosynthesis predicted pyruvyltransferase EpsI
VTDAAFSHTAILDAIWGEKRIVFVPNVGNLGDALIAHSTYHLLNRRGLVYEIAKVTDDVRGACVLIGGGGNLIEGRYDDLGTFMRRCGRHNRIVVLPHTVVGNVELFQSLSGSSEVFARERTTYDFLVEIGLPSGRVHLAHDMAFSLDGELTPPARSTAGSVLICLRRDAESALVGLPPSGNLDVSSLMLHDWADPKLAQMAAEIFLTIVGRYESIITDRLHVAIAGHLLRRRVTLVANCYFKNRAVYEFSLAQSGFVTFVDIEPGHPVAAVAAIAAAGGSAV